MKHLIFFILLLFGLMFSQSMYIDANETRKVYSLVGSYQYPANDSIDYEYSLGVSSIFRSNNELEFLFNKSSIGYESFIFSYKYHFKFKQNINLFLGSNYSDNTLLSTKNQHASLFGVYFKFKGETLTFFPFIQRNQYNDNNLSFSTLGLSMLFYDIGLQPELSVFDNGDIFYNFKFFLWEYR